jgi:hypothetical protein
LDITIVAHACWEPMTGHRKDLDDGK